MFDDRLFFQLAAALIPAILFGGLVTRAFGPSQTDSPRGLSVRVSRLILAAAAVGVVVLAETFAIDLATSPESPESYKVAFVVTAVVGGTTLAGAALLWPWIKELPEPWQSVAAIACAVVGSAVALIGTGLLTDSIVEAEGRLAAQQTACLRTEGNRRLREEDRDEFMAMDTAGARAMELQELRDERVRLRYEEGLSASEREARQASLQRRIDDTEARLDLARDNFENVIERSSLTVEQLGLDPEKDLSADEVIERFLRAFGC